MTELEPRASITYGSGSKSFIAIDGWSLKDKPNPDNPEEIKRTNEYQSEYWSARQLAKALEYSEFRHFQPVIAKAKVACKNSGQSVKDHFEDVLDMVEIGSSASLGKDLFPAIVVTAYLHFIRLVNSNPDYLWHYIHYRKAQDARTHDLPTP